ncbi:MAG: hypothetical protein LUD84_09290, partial [Clostridiales bacterium]|nr:hypothetical protein [Clostridiales bacterium]
PTLLSGFASKLAQDFAKKYAPGIFFSKILPKNPPPIPLAASALSLNQVVYPVRDETKSKPSEAGSILRGGVAERTSIRLTDGCERYGANADEVRLPPMAAGYDCRSTLCRQAAFPLRSLAYGGRNVQFYRPTVDNI